MIRRRDNGLKPDLFEHTDTLLDPAGIDLVKGLVKDHQPQAIGVLIDPLGLHQGGQDRHIERRLPLSARFAPYGSAKRILLSIWSNLH